MKYYTEKKEIIQVVYQKNNEYMETEKEIYEKERKRLNEKEEILSSQRSGG